MKSASPNPLAFGLKCAVLISASLLALPTSLDGSTRTNSADSQIVISTGRAGCSVELDATAMGKTDAQGHLTLDQVEPTDHYVHLRCPDEPQESSYLVSPGSGGIAKVEHLPALHPPSGSAGGLGAAGPSLETSPDDSSDPALDIVEAKMKLRQLLQEAIQLRNHGSLTEAVSDLREATHLDPENSDLHRELGITFLLSKDWKRARVEMIEAIRHNPSDADAHNGLGYALEKLGRTESALQEYRTATHLEPDDPSYREHYIGALGRLSAEQAAAKKK